VVWGQEYKYKSLKSKEIRYSELMPKNVTVSDSGKISLHEFIIKIFAITLAASR